MSVFTRTALAAALLAAAPLASAATASANMNVSIKIENSCVITANPLAFGTRTTLATNIDVDTSVDIVCTGDGSLSIAFTAGGGDSATFASRKMTDTVTGDTISYSLYRNSGRTEVLGDGTDSVVISGFSTAGVASFPVHGRVFAGQNPKSVGSYSDTVVATVTF